MKKVLWNADGLTWVKAGKEYDVIATPSGKYKACYVDNNGKPSHTRPLSKWRFDKDFEFAVATNHGQHMPNGVKVIVYDKPSEFHAMKGYTIKSIATLPKGSKLVMFENGVKEVVAIKSLLRYRGDVVFKGDFYDHSGIEEVD